MAPLLKKSSSIPLSLPSSISSEGPYDRCRSVNDFDSDDDLRRALGDKTYRRSSFVGSYWKDDYLEEVVENEDDEKDSGDEDDSKTITVSKNAVNTELDWAIENLDPETSESQNLEAELARLQVLRSYLILDAEREESFERLTAMAARMFDVPIALVSLVDLGRQWFMSNRGLGDARETPRKLAFCAHAILSTNDLLIVPDATKDTRFMANALVTGPPHVCFYAGAPLISPEGVKLGTFCIIDTRARPNGLSLCEKQNLRELADLVVGAMVERRQKKLLTSQDTSKLIACTAHDLLTPLSAIQLSLTLLRDDDNFLKKLNPSQRELIETAGGCCKMMTQICDEAVTSFKEDAEQMAVDRQAIKSSLKGKPGDGKSYRVVVLSDFVQNIKMIMDPHPKSVPLYITVSPEVPEEVVSDDLKIFRSAINYLTNAFKVTKKGCVHLKIFVKNIKRKKQELVFECRDTGSGVAPEVYPRLFHAITDESDVGDNQSCINVDGDGNFVKHSACFATSSSTGIGLYSVAANVSSLGGQYGFFPVSSETNAEEKCYGWSTTGSVFWFSIPLILPESRSTDAKVTQAAITEKAIAYETPPFSSDIEVVRKTVSTARASEARRRQSASRSSLRSLRSNQGTVMDDGISFDKESRPRMALVIDDSIVIRKSLCRALTAIGFVVHQANDGMEGLKQLKSDVFDVVLCDFLMPVMDGLDCVQQYRSWEESHRPWVRQYIIGISAHASERDAERGVECGMDTFFSKPVSLDVIKQLKDNTEIDRISKMLDKSFLEDKMIMHVSFSEPDGTLSGSSQKVKELEVSRLCLIAQDSESVSKTMSTAVESMGWKAVIVDNGNDALIMLKTRNWNCVFIDEELPELIGLRCIERFRDWEKENRVVKQRNVFMICNNYVPPPSAFDNDGSCVMFPNGFDGAISRPIILKDLYDWLDLAAKNCESDIILR